MALPGPVNLPRESFTFNAIPLKGHAQRPLSDGDGGEGDLTAEHLRAQADVHCERVEPFTVTTASERRPVTDYYGVCSCGQPSLAHSSAREAFAWRCPKGTALREAADLLDAADEACANTEQVYLARLSEAQLRRAVR